MNKLIVGLDVGTSSVGWCATDENFDITKINGKVAWGSRLFDEAEDSKNRRTFRSARRRLKRRKSRLYLLDKIFEQDILLKDDSFFIRLHESNLHLDDKTIKFKYPLFKEKRIEKDYYRRFPTIFHLRKALINNDEYALSDVRFVYLALHHIIKYRGNFLSKAESFSNTLDENIAFDFNNDLFAFISNNLEKEIEDNSIINLSSFSKEICNILLDKETNKKEKQKKIIKLFNIINLKDLESYIKMFATLVTGGTYSIKSLKGEYENSDIKCEFKDDLDISLYEKELGNAYFILDYAYQIYCFIRVKEIIGSHTFLSEAFIDDYNLHKSQLKKLKKVLNEIDTNKKDDISLYRAIFSNKSTITKIEELDKNDSYKCSYSEFIGKGSDSKRSKIQDFNKTIRVILEQNHQYVIKNVDDYNEILQLVKDNRYLLKISDNSSGIIPHQLHLMELKLILENASKKYAFINKNKERIIDIFKFKIDYWVGPLNSIDDKSNNLWGNATLKQEFKNQKLCFENYKNALDEKATKRKFIDERLNYCFYLYGELTLPKQSILYTSYVLLDKLNTMRVNDRTLDFSEKKYILSKICNDREVSISKIKTILCNYEGKQFDKDLSITGINTKDKIIVYPINEFLNFYNNDSNKLLNNIAEIEEIIKILTVYKDNIKDGQEEVFKLFKKELNDEQKRIIKRLRFSGYGSFSSKLLFGLKRNEKSILDYLYESNSNFQQIINDDNLNFSEEINKSNDEYFGEKMTKKERIDEILDSLPAKNRRSIKQCIRIISEIKRFSKRNIDTLVIESTRRNLTSLEKEEARKIKARKDYLSDLYKQIEKLNELDEEIKNDIVKSKEELTRDNINLRLKSKHIYLYFRQLGRDLYTNRPIYLQDVIDGKYDIDHIYPQSKIKDDSFDNIVLTAKTNNKFKGDIYPIPEKIRNNDEVKNLWSVYRKLNLISEVKYKRLTRNYVLTEEELTDFAANQLKVVDFVNKKLKDVVDIMFDGKTNVVFNKAQYVADLRQKYGILKLRDLNDTHHAVDAYLNIICGIILNSLFGNLRFIKAKKSIDLNESFNPESRLLGYLKSNNLKEKIIKNCERRDFLLTFRLNYESGSFYKQKMFKKNSGKKLFPIHTKGSLSDVSKYGGYSSVSTDYFLLAEETVNNKKEKTLLLVTHYINNLFKGDVDKIYEYLMKNNYRNKQISLCSKKKIYSGQKVVIKGGEFLMFSSDENRVKLKNLNPVFLSNDDSTYLKRFLNFKIEKESDIIPYSWDDDGVILKEFTKTKNLDIFKKLLSNIANNYYSSYTGFKGYDSKLSYISDNGNLDLTMEKWQKEFKDLLEFYSRQHVWRLSFNSFLSIAEFWINDSTTGLLSNKEKI